MSREWHGEAPGLPQGDSQPFSDPEAMIASLRAPEWPTLRQKQLSAILAALRFGRRLTVGDALRDLGCYALSQRIGQLRGMGWPVRTQMVRRGNTYVAEYSL